MLIEQLSDTSVKYTLTLEELDGYGLDFESISQYDSNTRVMVSHLMLLAESQPDIEIEFNASDVYVEAFSCSNGNCIVYISIIRHSIPRKKLERGNSIVCNTDSLDHLVRLSVQLLKFSKEDITNSSLYFNDGVFFLLVEFNRSAFEKVLYSIAEFCEYSTVKGSHYPPLEYYQCLAPKDALTRLSLLES